MLKHIPPEQLKESATKLTSFTVKCGDWIYPSKDSTSGVTYSIDTPVVAEIFVDTSKVPVSKKGGIDYHLNSPRFLEIDLLCVPATDIEVASYHFHIKCLKNSYEPLFEKEINISMPLGSIEDIQKLDRYDYLVENGVHSDESSTLVSLLNRPGYSASIFFTSSLLKFLHEDWSAFDDAQQSIVFVEDRLQIIFRKATMPEIEALGTWRI